MDNIATTQTEVQYTQREKKLAAKHQVEPKLVRLLTKITQEQQEPADLLSMELNSPIIEDWFEKVEWSGKLAAVLLFNLLMSDSKRYREIGRHILRNLNENIYEIEGCVAEADMVIREFLFAIVELKARKSA